jgi:hypothetical protein
MFEFPKQGIRPVWIASYPRSGNTFLRIILESAFNLPSYSIYYVEGTGHPDPSAEALDKAPRLPQNWRNMLANTDSAIPIFIKTHDHPPDAAPTIFIARDGRAAIHSYFYYHKKFAFEQPSLTDVISGACQFGSWSEHYQAWHPKTRPNTLLLLYDELVNDPDGIIARLSQFLNLTPQNASLPDFQELQRRSPAFFRRGQNTDFLKEWTAGHMALFNQLHAAAMGDLGFGLVPSPGPSDGAIQELAQSAARLHRMYLEQLANVGFSMANHQQDVQRLSTKITELSQLIERILKPMLKTRWVRLGMAFGALPKVSNDELPASPPGSTDSPACPAGAHPLRSSDENSRLSSPDLELKQPSVPSEGVSAHG